MCLLSGVERFPLFGGFQCTNFNGRAIGTGKIVRYIEVVRSWEGPLIEVPLYYNLHLSRKAHDTVQFEFPRTATVSYSTRHRNTANDSK